MPVPEGVACLEGRSGPHRTPEPRQHPFVLQWSGSREACFMRNLSLRRSANTTGQPVLRPLWFEFPDNEGEGEGLGGMENGAMAGMVPAGRGRKLMERKGASCALQCRALQTHNIAIQTNGFGRFG